MIAFQKQIHSLVLMIAGSQLVVGQTHPMTEVFHDDHFQLTGVTVSKTGRLFVNYPRWSDTYRNAVVEVMKDGSAKPFPNQDWNVWDLKPATAGKHFVCVQSVVVDDSDTLWVVDPGAPYLISVVSGGAKLVAIDLKTNRVARVLTFGPDVVKPESYLNDIRFDLGRQTAYMTDSGTGGIVIVDLKSGNAHRALEGIPATKFEKGVQIVIDGKPVLGPDKQPPAFNSDGIALSPDGNYLYFQAVTAKTLYRVKTSVLRDNPSAAASSVEKVADTFPVDGLWMDKKGRLYLSDLTHDAVSRLLPNGKIETVATDKRLQWPDTFSEGPDGSIYITASHINDSPKYNEGLSVRKLPYTVFKIAP